MDIEKMGCKLEASGFGSKGGRECIDRMTENSRCNGEKKVGENVAGMGPKHRYNVSVDESSSAVSLKREGVMMRVDVAAREAKFLFLPSTQHRAQPHQATRVCFALPHSDGEKEEMVSEEEEISLSSSSGSLPTSKDDPSFTLRKALIYKIHKLLNEQAIPDRYACAFALASMDCVGQLRDDSMKFLNEFLQMRSRQFSIKIDDVAQKRDAIANTKHPGYVALVHLGDKQNDVSQITSYMLGIFSAIQKADDSVDAICTHVGSLAIKHLTMHCKISLDASHLVLLPSLYFKVCQDANDQGRSTATDKLLEGGFMRQILSLATGGMQKQAEKYIPLLKPLVLSSRKGLIAAILSGFLLIPAFYFTVKYGDQGWMIMLTSCLGLSNGYLTVCVLTAAPKGYKVYMSIPLFFFSFDNQKHSFKETKCE
ncbi:hypothetical protein ZIOFF_029529 [Zingiber officinale]|uniref:Uncharacterized protein n=1 Tax=Zingiber officinale TaxID=94328 RepID=A0A8J5GWT0_ZINOF|nr:hypothetical protein ZIOFF_029529 [Zingiber officinale]